MRYTKPTILNESKAARLIMGLHFKRADVIDSLLILARSDGAAYEADE